MARPMMGGCCRIKGDGMVCRNCGRKGRIVQVRALAEVTCNDSGPCCGVGALCSNGLKREGC